MMGSSKPIRSGLGLWPVLLLAAAGLGLASCASLPKIGKDAAGLIEHYRTLAARKNAAAQAEAEQTQTPASVEELLAQGDQLRDEGALADALFSYVRAHGAGQDRGEAGERIAFLHLRRDPDRAEAIFEALLESDPYSATLRMGLALAQLSKGDLDGARTDLDEAITLDPRSATPRLLLGVILDRLDDYEAAQEQYLAAHEMRPDDWVILNNLGVSYLQSDRPEAAEEVLTRAATLEPRDPVLRNNLGLALGLQGRPDEAFEQFARAAGKAEAHNNLGWVHYLQGEYGLALEEFEQALGVKGDKVLTVLRNIELASAALGDDAPAIGFDAVPEAQAF